jgi:hypothetical protein
VNSGRDLSILDDSEAPQLAGGILVDGEWVTRIGEKLLWIFDDYRTGPVSVCGDALVLDSALGGRALVQLGFSA